jgi:hypothetical protein
VKNLRLSAIVALSVALVLGLAPAASAEESRLPDAVTGTTDAPGVEVRIERSTTGDPDGPFETTTTTTTDTSGRYRVTLGEGLYRAVFNERPNGSAESRLHGSTTYRSDYWSNEVPYFTVEPRYQTWAWTQELNQTFLPYRTGRVTGDVSSICQEEQPRGRAEVYGPDDQDSATAGLFGFSEGTYDVHGFERPTKVLLRADGFVPRWIGGDDAASATAFDMPAQGADTQGPDVELAPVFAEGRTSTVRGWVEDARTRNGVAGLRVRLYRSTTGTPAGPWVLEASGTSGSASRTGSVAIQVPQGLYRATVNEQPDGSPASRTYRPQAWRHWSAPAAEGTGVEDATNICVNRDTVALGTESVQTAGGTLTGRVTDRRGKALYRAEVALYADDATTGDPIRTTRTNGRGAWEMPAIDGAAKLRVTPLKEYAHGEDVELYLPVWSGGAATASDATTVTAPEGGTTTVDLQVRDAPLLVQQGPTVPARPLAGSTVTANRGYAAIESVAYRFQWQRGAGDRWTSIPGATKQSYRPTSSDLGRSLRVQVTYVAPSSYPGIAPVTMTSAPSRSIVRTKARVRASAKATGSRSFTVSAKVALSGVSEPSGTAYVQWVRLTPRGNRLYPTGKVRTVEARYTRGVLRRSVKVSRSGYWAYAVIVPESRTVVEHYDDGYLRLR